MLPLKIPGLKDVGKKGTGKLLEKEGDMGYFPKENTGYGTFRAP